MEDIKKNQEDKHIAPVNRVFLATVLISLLATTAISIVVSLVARVIAKDEAHFDQMMNKFIDVFNNDLFGIVFSQLVLFLPVGIYIIRHRKRFVKKIRFKMLKPSTMALLVVFTITVTPVMSFINSLSLLFSDNVINETITGITSSSSMLISVLAVALLPAICEEVAYRGVFYSEYSSVSPRKAILLSGLMFGMLHMNLNQFVYAAAMGIVFALIVEATDSILSTMIIHLVSNGTSVLAMYAVAGTGETAGSGETEQTISEMFGEMASEEGISPAMKSLFEYLSGLPDQYAQTIFLGIVALIFGVVSFVIFIQIAKTTGRYKEVKKILFVKEKKNVNEDNSTKVNNGEEIIETEKIDDSPSGKIFTPSLIIAFVICVAFMIYRQIKGI